MNITVEQLLAQIKDNEVRCVAGFKGLSNFISGFTIIDTPNIVEWLTGGAFVTSLGYITNIHPEMRKTLVCDLAAKGCAALGIKKHSYYKETPAEYIEQGNQLNFPIIELPYNMLFSNIAYHIHQNIFAQNMSVMEQTYQIYERITSLVLSDASIEHILYDISRIIHNPVILADKDFEIVAYEIPSENPVDFLKIFSLEKNTKILPQKQLRKISSHYLDSSFASYKTTVEHNNLIMDVVSIPITSERELWGFLLVPETVKPLTGDKYKVLKNITSAISIYFMKNKYMYAVNTTTNTFLHHVLINNQPNKESIRYYCRMFDFDSQKKRICMDIYLEHMQSLPYEKRKSMKSLLEQSVRNICKKYELPYYSVHYDNHFVEFLYFSNHDTNEEAFEKVDELTVALNKFLCTNGVSVQIGISSCNSDLLHIPLSYKQALEIIRLGKRIYPTEAIHSFEKLKVYYTLHSTLSESELRDLANIVIGLEAPGVSDDCVYIDTLERFINNRFNITKTASEMFIHRNSMVYRLNRIRDILSVDWQNPEDMLKIQLGLHALKLLNTMN